MSSILDALRKVEADERRTPMRLPPPEPRPRGRLAALVAAAAFVTGAAVVALVVFLRPGADPVPDAAEVASAPPVQPAPAVTPPPAPPAAAAANAPPAATTPAPPAPASTPVAPTAAPAAPASEAPIAEESDVPEQITILRPAPAPAPAAVPDAGAQAEVQVEALPTPAPVEPPIDVLPGPPVGAPEIHVSFLIYSAVPARRQVSLTIDNGPLVTLHEGQKSGSISLVRILRDRIHVEHGGRTYSVRAVL